MQASAPGNEGRELAPAHEAGRRDGITERVDVDQAVARGIEALGSAADRHDDDPGAGRDDGERRRALQKVRIERGVGIVDAAVDRHSRVPGRALQRVPGRTGPRRSPARRTGANFFSPALPDNETGKSPAMRVPEIGMAAERRGFVGEHAAKPVRPVLRIGDDGPRLLRSRPGRLFPARISARQGSTRAAGAACRFRKMAAARHRTRRAVVRGRRTRSRAPAWRARRPAPSSAAATPCVVTEIASTGVSLLEGRQSVDDEGPETVAIVMRIEPVREDGVRGLADRDLRQRVEIDQRQLGVGLADIDDGDMARARHFM